MLIFEISKYAAGVGSTSLFVLEYLLLTEFVVAVIILLHDCLMSVAECRCDGCRVERDCQLVCDNTSGQ